MGKTTIAAGLARVLKNKGIDVGVMKPFATAKKIFSSDFKSEDAALLSKAARVEDSDDEINPYFYSIPTAPSIAAKIRNQEQIRLIDAKNKLIGLANKHSFTIVEGIGGLMVPLNEKELVLDFIKLIRLPIILVASSKLGTINHILLTIKVCSFYGLKIMGIIFNETSKKPNKVERYIVDTVKSITGIDVLCIIPKLKDVSSQNVSLSMKNKIDIEKILVAKQTKR